MKSVQKLKSASSQILVYFLIIFLLLLASINIKNYFAPQKVLGTETVIDNSVEFWEEFTAKNPNYIPGWIELGRLDRAKEIDPNFKP